MIDFDALNRELCSRALTWVPEILPGGQWKGNEYKCADIHGGHGQSMSVNGTTGKWGDFAFVGTPGGTASGGDLVSLYAAIHGLGMREAALELGAIDTDHPAQARRKRSNGANGHAQPAQQASITPPADAPSDEDSPFEAFPMPPDDAPLAAANFKHRNDGMPSVFWIYRDTAGKPLMAVARYDTEGGKEIRPWTWRNNHWTCLGPPRPKPLYGLDRLSTPGDVVIVEGEKAADAGRHYFAQPCVTWQGGTSAVKVADWHPLAGRAVIIWPDNDEVGIAAGHVIAGILVALGCPVSIVDPKGWPAKWDIADGLRDNLDPAQIDGYMAAHSAPVRVPARLLESDAEDSENLSAAEIQYLQTMPTGAVIEAKPEAGSLMEIYQRYGFNCRSNGRPYGNQFNVGCAIAARAGMEIYFDEFGGRIMTVVDDKPREWSEGLNLQFTCILQNELELYDIGPRTVRDGVAAYAFTHRRNPVRDWLRSLKWDGTSRLKDLMPIGFGAKRDAYSEAVGRCFIVGMVARVLKPGCQVDSMPVFEGDQGGGKTKALRIIGGEYFAEIHDSIMSKDFQISLQGKMLCEISELSAFRSDDVTRIKAILTMTIDHFRAPYEATSSDHPRQGVFSGTTNRDDWNTDETGARRFWPVLCGNIDCDWITEHRDVLFAEAVERFGDDDSWWNVPADRAEEEQVNRQDSDGWEEIIGPYLRMNPVVRVPYLLCDVIGMKAEKMDMSHQRRIARILRKNGYRKHTKREGVLTARVWERKP